MLQINFETLKPYSVMLLGANYKNKELIQAISKIIGKNYLEVRKLLKQERPLVFEGQANHVLIVIDILKSFGLDYKITPEYKY